MVLDDEREVCFSMSWESSLFDGLLLRGSIKTLEQSLEMTETGL